MEFRTGWDDPVVALFNMQAPEWAVVIFLFFLLFGAKKIPELMRSLGRAQGEFQRAKKDFEKEVKEADKERKATEVDAVTPPLPAADPLEEARKRALALGIEVEGKDLDTLKKEIGEKVLAGDV